ncbi:MAG: GreA/GreB family elongation factor [Lachnospiraceae bacterium]
MFDELTKDDIQKMSEEVEHRRLIVRKEALEAVKEARAHGDLSENFEYKAAKQFKNQNESRIRYLEKMIRTAKIVEEEDLENVVTLNTKVTVFMGEDDCEEEYLVVTPLRGNSLKNMISNKSPLGSAIYGKKAGERIEVQVDQNYSYFLQIIRVERIENPHELEIKKF